MSVSSPNGRKESAMSNGQAFGSGADGVLTLDESDQTLTAAPVTTTGSKRGTDYRLRGLDLEAQRKSQPPILPARKDEPRRRHRRRVLIGWVIVVAVATIVAVVLRLTVAEPFTVPSSAMAPTLQAGDRILVVKSHLAGPIETGNIIVFRHPEPYPCSAGSAGAQDLVQRVIGMPGQTIWSAGDAIYVNGRKVDSRLAPGPRRGRVDSKPIPLTTVPAGEYYVMGDNSSQSCDSRSFGAVPASSVIGKVVSIVLRAGHPYIHVF